MNRLDQRGVPVYPVADGSKGAPVVWIDPETDLPVVPSQLVQGVLDAALPSAVAKPVGDAVTAALAASGVGDVGTFTLATLPDPRATARRTAWVSDLYGVGGRVVSEGGFWKPIRPLAASSMASPTADMTVTPLLAATTLIVTGTLSATRNLTLGLGTGFALPYPGYRQRITRKSAGALTSLLVNGVGLSLNGWADFEFDGAAWVQTASGGLL